LTDEAGVVDKSWEYSAAAADKQIAAAAAALRYLHAVDTAVAEEVAAQSPAEADDTVAACL